MARRRRAERREVAGDPRYHSTLVANFINKVMSRGKKNTAARIVYGAMDELGRQTGEEPLDVFEQAIDNIKPRLEVKSRRVGGATYQVPMEVKPSRQVALALRWLIQYATGRRGIPVQRALANELLDAYRNQGAAVKKRDDTHKMAQANKAFAHYRW